MRALPDASTIDGLGEGVSVCVVVGDGSATSSLSLLLEPFVAACAGVHGHQRAGRIAAERVGAVESVIATDVIAALPAALSR